MFVTFYGCLRGLLWLGGTHVIGQLHTRYWLGRSVCSSFRSGLSVRSFPWRLALPEGMRWGAQPAARCFSMWSGRLLVVRLCGGTSSLSCHVSERTNCSLIHADLGIFIWWWFVEELYLNCVDSSCCVCVCACLLSRTSAAPCRRAMNTFRLLSCSCLLMWLVDAVSVDS